MKDDQSSKKKKRKKNINKKLNEKPNKSIKITEKKTNPNSFSSHSTFSRDFEISEKEIEEFRKKLKDNSIPAHLVNINNLIIDSEN